MVEALAYLAGLAWCAGFVWATRRTRTDAQQRNEVRVLERRPEGPR